MQTYIEEFFQARAHDQDLEASQESLLPRANTRGRPMVHRPRTHPGGRLQAGLSLLVFVLIFCILRDDDWRKCWQPTIFPSEQELLRLLPKPPIRTYQDRDIDDRYEYTTQLSAGHEGTTSIYIDNYRHEAVVIKTYDTAHHPLRNSLPDDALHHFEHRADMWPSEIPASLLFGGLERESTYSPNRTYPPGRDFLPVYDYFLATPNAQAEADWQWHLVTPLLPLGTPAHFVPMLPPRVPAYGNDISALDTMFRPALSRLLQTIETLHASDLCHDDIKPTNIFVRNTTHWILGDLGAVRQTKHAWHSTRLWRAQDQLADCQRNDLQRLLRVYLGFLRTASEDKYEFDRLFWSGSASWAKTYWRFMAEEALDVDNMRQFQLEPHRARGRPYAKWRLSKFFLTEKATLAWATQRELEAQMQDSWQLWRFGDWVVFGWWTRERVVTERKKL